jgi:hypothetical protein
MIDVVGKRCKYGGCLKHPTFNYEGKRPKYCKEHQEKGMIDVVSKRCQHGDCLKQPHFNYDGEKPKYCKEHKEKGMIDVVNIRCQHECCPKQPAFGYKGEKPKYCKDHQGEGMINIVSKECQHEGCSIQPHFGYKGEKPIYCKKHQEKGMIDVVSKRCQYEGCSMHPIFGYKGEKPKYCAKHQEKGMINVVSKKCQHENCKSLATYSLLGNIPYHCAVHADKHLEITRPKRHCSKCNKLATHGNKYPVRCETHSNPEDQTFETSVCSLCHFPAIIDRNGHCYFCDPERQFVVRLAQQNKTSDYLSRYFTIETIDTVVDSKCGKERPDIVINSKSGNFKFDVEVDEHQHKRGNYQELCTCVRMKNIAEMFGLPTLYIRFNPDEYKTPDPDEVPMKKRLLRLKKVIEKYINTESLPCTIGIIKMYFDGWTENEQVEITVIEP